MEEAPPGQSKRRRVAILTGADTPLVLSAILDLCNSPHVQVEAVISLFAPRRPFARRLAQLGRTVASCGVSPEDVTDLLRRAFPDRPWAMQDLLRRGLPIYEVSSFEGAAARNLLRRVDADYWIVIEAAIPPTTLGVRPRLGCVRGYLHERDVLATLRSGAPLFVEAELVTSPAESRLIDRVELRVHPRDTRQTLFRKYQLERACLLVRAFERLAASPDPASLPLLPGPPSPRPAVEPGSEHASPLWKVTKLVVYAAIYYAGVFHAFRALRRWIAGERALVVAYHRVNDVASDTLTISLRDFARHLLVLKRDYACVHTRDIVASVKHRAPLPRNSVAIHFDDCYRDVHDNAAPLLRALDMSACVFVSSGFVDSGRAFAHDEKKCPFPMENLTSSNLRALAGSGIEIGAHTVNHVNLGDCALEEADREIRQSRADLEAITGRPVTLFAFPYGRPKNIQPGIKELAVNAGYDAMFSAYGGGIPRNCDPYNLRRVGLSGQFHAIEMLFEMEGISAGALLRRAVRPPYGS